LQSTQKKITILLSVCILEHSALRLATGKIHGLIKTLSKSSYAAHAYQLNQWLNPSSPFRSLDLNHERGLW